MIRFWHIILWFFFLYSSYSLSIGHLILISFKAHITLFFIFDEEYKYKSYVTVSPWVSFAIFCFSFILVFLNGIQIKISNTFSNKHYNDRILHSSHHAQTVFFYLYFFSALLWILTIRSIAFQIFSHSHSNHEILFIYISAQMSPLCRRIQVWMNFSLKCVFVSREKSQTN